MTRALEGVSQGKLSAWSASEYARVASDARSVWLALGIAANRGETTSAPARIVLALDRSSSMEGGKLELALRAARAMVEMMRDGDELGLVIFDAEVKIEAPVAMVTPKLRAELHARLSQVKIGRGTALSEAATCALELARTLAPAPEGRAILLTDGYPFGGETEPMVIVDHIERAAQNSVLSVIGIGHDLDAPLLASMADVGLGRFLHLADDEDPVGALGAELYGAQHTVTRRLHVTVQLREGQSGVHGGVVDPNARGLGASFWLPPLIENESEIVPIELVFASSLPMGRVQVGLSTIRTVHVDGSDAALEIPLELEVAARGSGLDPRVMRARSLFEVAHALRQIAMNSISERDVHELLALSGRISARAEMGGLEGDLALQDMTMLLHRTACSLLRGSGELPIAAWALALQRAYDPSCGTRTGGALGSLIRESQAIGANTAVRVLETLLAGRGKGS